MTIKEVYEKWAHLDQALSESFNPDFRNVILLDLWQAIKEEVEKQDQRKQSKTKEPIQTIGDKSRAGWQVNPNHRGR